MSQLENHASFVGARRTRAFLLCRAHRVVVCLDNLNRFAHSHTLDIGGCCCWDGAITHGFLEKYV